MSAQKTKTGLIAENRRARHEYHLGEDIEVGIVLTGPEVKSMRSGQVNIADGYVSVDGGELWLRNAYVAPYDKACSVSVQDTRRTRKLLAKKREIAKIWNETQRKGMTAVPVRIYFDARGRVKMVISLAKGKNASDKRQAAAKRDWGVQKARILKQARNE